MSDFSLFWSDAEEAADLGVANNDLLTDDGLESAVYLSLFTDARAEESDTLPHGETDRRGWWGGAIGSRLWLLARAKDVPDTYAKAKQYALEALQWMLDEKVAASVDVTAARVAQFRAALVIKIARPERDLATFHYNYNWLAQQAKRG